MLILLSFSQLFLLFLVFLFFLSAAAQTDTVSSSASASYSKASCVTLFASWFYLRPFSLSVPVLLLQAPRIRTNNSCCCCCRNIDGTSYYYSQYLYKHKRRRRRYFILAISLSFSSANFNHFGNKVLASCNQHSFVCFFFSLTFSSPSFTSRSSRSTRTYILLLTHSKEKNDNIVCCIPPLFFTFSPYVCTYVRHWAAKLRCQ